MTTTTLADLTWPVRTDRLEIRPLREGDADALWAYRRLPEVSMWTGSRSPDRSAFAERYLSPEKLRESLAVEHDGRIVGDLLVTVEDGWAQHEAKTRAAKTQAELGWTFDPAVGGRGLAT